MPAISRERDWLPLRNRAFRKLPLSPRIEIFDIVKTRMRYALPLPRNHIQTLTQLDLVAKAPRLFLHLFKMAAKLGHDINSQILTNAGMVAFQFVRNAIRRDMRVDVAIDDVDLS
jgi:hypothetical protein